MTAGARAALVAFALTALGGPSPGEACRRADDAKARRTASRDCPPRERLEPYDPSRSRAGRTPGFIDLGNGTEVRIGGRVRTEYDVRR